MKKFLFFSGLVFHFFFSSCDNAKTKNKSRGQILYESYCTNCHGTDGKYCALGAKDLSLSEITKEQAAAIIANGKSTMTPFKNLMTEEEILTVSDYIQTFKK